VSLVRARGLSSAATLHRNSRYFRPDALARAPYKNLLSRQTICLRLEPYVSGLPGLRADDYKYESVESRALFRLKRFKACCIAVINSNNLARTANLKARAVS